MKEFKEKWDDPVEKSKIQLVLFLIFIVFAVVFARFTRVDNNELLNKIGNIINEENNIKTLEDIKDNYYFNVTINVNDKELVYGGIVYQNYSVFNEKKDNVITNYYKENDIYYVYEDNNYNEINIDNIFDVNYEYLKIDNILKYINLGIKDDNIYLVKVSNLNNSSDSKEYVTIEVIETKTNIELIIDYTNLFKNNNINSYKVKYIIEEIDKITLSDIELQKNIEKSN